MRDKVRDYEDTVVEAAQFGKLHTRALAHVIAHAYDRDIADVTRALESEQARAAAYRADLAKELGRDIARFNHANRRATRFNGR